MHWRYKIIAILLFICLTCGGCMGSREIDELSFVLTIGVDKAPEDGLYIYTFRIAMPRAFTGDGGGDNKEKTKLVSVKSPALGTAIRQLAVAMNRQPELSHASALFISEAVARDGISDIVSLLLRSKIYRSSMVLLVTKEDAKTALEKNTTPFELFQYRWVDSVRKTQSIAAFYTLNDIRKFYVQMADPQQAILTGFGAIIDKSLDKKAADPLPHQIVPQFQADDFPREGGTELIVVGSAIFKNWKMVGTLNTSESLGANILDKGIKTVLTIPDPIDQGSKVTMGVDIGVPKIKVALQNGKMIVDVNTNVICDLFDTSSNVDYTKKENRLKLEDQLNSALKASLIAYFAKTQELESDCLRVSNKYRYQVSTWQDWADIDWPSVYRDADININIKSSMRRAGLLWRYATSEEI